ncbi:MAG: Ig-like domain-containing protein [Candidatus Thiothrix putei]|uniref:Ig-like domain-containing protein n=1 Tax=Candidatus Thiothrix putei TaxID=3080811 RepID=A0AA95KIA3_9GAMM|nr:MAG: Ig-like domain-containing protein [Candidatus Thiothrix putei]
MNRPPVAPSLMLCSVVLLSGCNIDKSLTVAANDSNANTTTTAPTSNTNTSTTTTTPAQAISVAGKAYVGDQGMVVIYAGGNATAYSSTDTSSAAAKPTALTWALDGTTLTLASAGGTQTFTVAADGATLTAGNVIYRQGKALVPTQWAGVDVGTATLGAQYYVTWRFTATQLVITEKGGSGFSRTSTLDVEAVPGVDNVWYVHGSVSGVNAPLTSTPAAAYIALVEGDTTAGSRWQWVAATQDTALSALSQIPLQFKKQTTSTPVPPAANTAPIAALDTATVTAGESVTINVLANDTDPNSDPLSIASFGQGAHGAVTQVGNSLKYTPAAGFTGVDSFKYKVKDAHGAETEGTVSVTVKEIPVTVLTATTSADSMAMIFMDTTGIALGEVTGGRVTLSTNAIIFFPANQTDAGTGTVSYVGADGKHYRIDIEITAKVEGGGGTGGNNNGDGGGGA